MTSETRVMGIMGIDWSAEPATARLPCSGAGVTNMMDIEKPRPSRRRVPRWIVCLGICMNPGRTAGGEANVERSVRRGNLDASSGVSKRSAVFPATPVTTAHVGATGERLAPVPLPIEQGALR